MEALKALAAENPAPADLVAGARAMIPVLAGRSREGRRARQVVAETIAEMQAAGFFRVFQPRRWGGYEMDPGAFYDIQLALAEGDMSTAWLYGVLGVHPWFLGLIDDRAAQEVWGRDDRTLICSSLMPAGQAQAVDGGFKLSGHWRYASGCAHCAWALLGGMVANDAGPPEGRIFLVPRADYRAVDTWQVAGLQATGSWDVHVDGAFVRASHPAHGRQLQSQGRGPGGQYVESLPAAVRADFRARHFNLGARRFAGHVRRVSRPR
jgi:3-hydroxy-9,10-secoandrosta-1,3,5(10)-triene-9,17-dione monooxygenase